MASITITNGDGQTIYRRVGAGYTGELYQAPEQGQVPALVAEAMGLLPCSFNGEGFPVEYILHFPLMDERIVHTAKREAVQEAQEAPPALLVAKDGTFVREGFDWRLDARPEAVRQGGCKLRGEGKDTFIALPEPATTKAAFHEGEHRRATMIFYRAEAQGRRRVA